MVLRRSGQEWVRLVVGPVVHRVAEWVTRMGAVGPRDRLARRYASVGEGSAIGFPRGAVFGEQWISIGADTLIAPHVSMSVGLPTMGLEEDAPPAIEIGDRCSIGRGSWLVGGCGIVVEDDVIFGPNVYVTDHNHGYEDVTVPIWQQWPQEAPVRIGAGSWLGANVVVLPGADIGRHVTVAAGSVVRGTVPDRCVVAGAPARVVRRHDDADGWVPPLRPVADVTDVRGREASSGS